MVIAYVRPDLRLTPFPKARCWKKFRSGIVYYIGKGNDLDWSRPQAGTSPRSDAYRAALAEWSFIAAQLDSDEQRGVDTSTKHYRAWLKRLRKELPPFAVDKPSPSLHFSYKPPKAKIPAIATDCDYNRVNDLINAYLKDARSKVPSQYSVKHYKEQRDKLTYFGEFCEHQGVSLIDEIDVRILQEFREEQLYFMSPRESDERISFATAKKRLYHVKKWLLWCEEMTSALVLPRFLTESFSKITKPRTEDPDVGHDANPVFKIAEIRKLWSLATERTRLYLLLGLNCGFTQIDCATLQWDHFDAKSGTINRTRHKTRHHATKGDGKASPGYVRQVHKLWPETLELLRKLATPKTSGPMLLNNNGSTLLSRRINTDGTVSETDAIRLAFDRLRKQWAKSPTAGKERLASQTGST